MPRQFTAVAVLSAILLAPIAFAQSSDNAATLFEKTNVVDFAKPSAAWSGAQLGQTLTVHDRLRTGEESRAAAKFGDASVLRIDELTTIEILPPQQAGAKATLDLNQGSTYFFSREKSREINFHTPAANGAIRGTEFLLRVTAQQHTILTMLKGEVELSNARGAVLVHAGEQVDVAPDAKPEKQSGRLAENGAAWHLLIEAQLTSPATLKNAPGSDLLAAVRSAVKAWPHFAPQMISAAVRARRVLAAQIIAAALESAKGSDCEAIAEIVAAGVDADPSDAGEIMRVAFHQSPGCYEMIARVLQGKGRLQKQTGFVGFSNAFTINPADVVSPEQPPRH
ncbi:MAG: hypothetical protein QOG48_2413 [Verrucomicrobiota bacterium]